MDDVSKIAAVTAIVIPAITIVNIVLGALAIVAFYFVFRTIYTKWLEPKVVKFGQEVDSEVNPRPGEKP